MEMKMANDGRNDGEKHCYDDIIGLPHHTSAVHPPMTRIDRAAQFSPFAALTGYHAAIEETERLTDARIELSEDAKAILDERLWMMQGKTDGCPEAAITYFQPDDRKEGGAYVTATGKIKKADMEERAVIMENGTKIPIDNIVGLEMESER